MSLIRELIPIIARTHPAFRSGPVLGRAAREARGTSTSREPGESRVVVAVGGGAGAAFAEPSSLERSAATARQLAGELHEVRRRLDVISAMSARQRYSGGFQQIAAEWQRVASNLAENEAVLEALARRAEEAAALLAATETSASAAFDSGPLPPLHKGPDES